MTIELRKKITQQIGEALGYASLCWEPKPTGVFDTTAVSKAMDHAMANIDALLDVVEAINVEDVEEKIAALETENAKLREALRYIAGSMRWGEDTAIKRTITDLQNTALAALETTNG